MMISEKTGTIQCEMGDLMSALVNSNGVQTPIVTLTQYC